MPHPARTHQRPESGRILGAKHRRRIKLMLILGSGIVIAASSFWAVYFVVMDQLAGLPLELALICVGGVSIMLVKRRRVNAASLLLLISLLVAIGSIALLLDVPTPNVHRASHNFLPAIGACAYLLLRGRNKWLQHGVMLLFFASYCVLDGTRFGMSAAYQLPEDMRRVSTWATDIFACLTLFMAIYVMQADVAEGNALEADLREAVIEGRLTLYYQPQMSDDGRLMGAEALVRWQHPVHGLLMPEEFIPLAERTTLILPLGDWMLKQACMQLAAWRHVPALASVQLTVNVSAQQLRQPDFVPQVLEIASRCGIEPGRLKLALTENMLIDDVEGVIAKMQQLKASGVALSLDDFGTGYSSLSYLKRLPLDQLKIDRAFVCDMLRNAQDAAIAQTVVSLGQNLGMEVIAEGVETEAQRSFLASIGCKVFQGQLFSEALPSWQFDAFVKGLGAWSPQSP